MVMDMTPPGLYEDLAFAVVEVAFSLYPSLPKCFLQVSCIRFWTLLLVVSLVCSQSPAWLTSMSFKCWTAPSKLPVLWAENPLAFWK
jgi:hypothetical protein